MKYSHDLPLKEDCLTNSIASKWMPQKGNYPILPDENDFKKAVKVEKSIYFVHHFHLFIYCIHLSLYRSTK